MRTQSQTFLKFSVKYCELNSCPYIAAVFSSSRFDHITPLFWQVHWLKAPQRIQFKFAVLVYKCLHGMAPSYQWAPALGRFRGTETAALHLLIIADCPSYTAVHRRRSGLSCCCRPYLEQSASSCHVRTLYACFPSTIEGFSLQAFLSVTRYLNFCSACAVTVVIFGHFNRSFYLLTDLLTYLLTR